MFQVETCAMKQQLETVPDVLSMVMYHGAMVTTQKQSNFKPIEDLVVTCPIKVHQIKTMLISFDVQGIVHSEFVPPGQAINLTFYLEVLRKLHKCS